MAVLARTTFPGDSSMIKQTGLALVSATLLAGTAHAGVQLIAIGTIDGTYEDRSAETGAALENGVHGNRLGGIGSGLAYAGGTKFLGLPDRGPNANVYNSLVDDTVSYIARFHTIDLRLSPSDPGAPPALHADPDHARHHIAVEPVAAGVRHGRRSGHADRRRHAAGLRCAGAELDRPHALLHRPFRQFRSQPPVDRPEQRAPRPGKHPRIERWRVGLRLR